MKIRKCPKKREDLVIEKVLENDYKGVLSNFANRLNADERNLEYFFYNANRVKFKELPEEHNRLELAIYDYYRNIIRFRKKYFEKGINHELFHLASRVRTDKCVHLGFSQIDLENNTNIGIGLTEAYTCLLDERYFPDKEKEEVLNNTYAITKRFAFLLEKFVTEEVMEDLYFKADLKGLIDILSNYISRDEVIAFIKALDNIFFYCDNVQIPNIIIAKQNYEYANEFISKCFLRLFADEFVQDEIDYHIYKLYQDMIWRESKKKLRFKGLDFFATKSISKKEFEKYNDEAIKLAIKKYT